MGVVVLPPSRASVALQLPERRAGFRSRAPLPSPPGGAAPGTCLRRGFWGSKQCSPLELRRDDRGASRNANRGLVAGDEFRPEEGKTFQKQPLAGRERSRLPRRERTAPLTPARLFFAAFVPPVSRSDTRGLSASKRHLLIKPADEFHTLNAN